MKMSNSDQNVNGNTGKSCVHNCQFFGSENRQAYLNTHTSGSWLGFIVYLRTIQEHWVKAVSVGVSLNDGLIKGFMDLFKLSIIDCWPLSAAFLEARRGLADDCQERTFVLPQRLLDLSWVWTMYTYICIYYAFFFLTETIFSFFFYEDVDVDWDVKFLGRERPCRYRGVCLSCSFRREGRLRVLVLNLKPGVVWWVRW